ncbi:MAG: caspase family protein, partial [Bacteroidota bacterium]
VWRDSSVVFLDTFGDFSLDQPNILHAVRTTSKITALAISPDSRLLITGHANNIIRAWTISPGNIAAETREMRGHYDPISHLAFHPLGQYILSASEDKTMRLWEAKTGKPAKIYRGESREILHVDFHPDGTSFLACSKTGPLVIWDLQSQKSIREVPTNTWGMGVFKYAAYGPEGKKIISVSEKSPKVSRNTTELSLAIWNHEIPHPIRTQDLGEISDAYLDYSKYFLVNDGTKLFYYGSGKDPNSLTFGVASKQFKSVEIPEYDANQLNMSQAPIRSDAPNAIIDPFAVDQPILKGKQNREKDLAIIVANQDYQKTNPVEFAIHDGNVLKQHLIQTLGFDPNNVILLQNAGINDLVTWMGNDNNPNGKLASLLQARQGEGQIFFYYVGHGVPGNDSTSYLLTVDGDPSNPELSGGYSLKTLYKNLSGYEASLKVVMIDACFSGQRVEYQNQLGRPVPKLKQSSQSLAIDPNLIVLSAAKDNETAASFPAKQHSLFTFWVLRAMHDAENVDLDANGEVSYQELFYYISDPLKAIPFYAQRAASSTLIQQHPQMVGEKQKEAFFQYK